MPLPLCIVCLICMPVDGDEHGKGTMPTTGRQPERIESQMGVEGKWKTFQRVMLE